MLLKKLGVILSFIWLSTLLVSCQQKEEVGEQQTYPQIPYSYEEAIEKGDVVDMHGEVSNVENFTSFIEHVEQQTEDEIRITIYTVEGAPIFYDLRYDGKKIHYTYDDSLDGFGGPDTGIEKTTCSEIVSEQVEEGTRYQLQDCTDEVGDTFYFVAPKEEL